MSGGYFDYIQMRMDCCEAELEAFIREQETLDSKYVDEEYYAYNHNFSKETMDQLKEGLRLLRLSTIYIQRIDYLISGDDGQESFHRRLSEDLQDPVLREK